MAQHGYRVVTADGFLSYYEGSKFNPSDKVAIKLEGTNCLVDVEDPVA